LSYPGIATRRYVVRHDVPEDISRYAMPSRQRCAVGPRRAQ